MDDNTKHVMWGSASTEYSTPAEIFEPIEEAMGINFDAAASHENHRTPHYATKDGVFTKHFSTAYRYPTDEDGLTCLWTGFHIWCNPPYGRGIEAWVKKAALECGPQGRYEKFPDTAAALLLPARTETDWFQRWVAPYAVVHFVMGRIRFWGHLESCFWHNTEEWDYEGECYIRERGEPDHATHQLPAAPFPSVIAEYSPRIVVAQGRISGRTWDPRTSAFEPAVPVKI